VVPVAEGAGSPERRLARPPITIGNGAWTGSGPEHEVVDRVEATLEWLGRPRPEVTPQADRLVEVCATDMEAVGDSQVRELALVPADADPGDHPTAAQGIERRELLGENHRVALRDDDDARPEADTRVSCTDPGEGQDRVVDMTVLAGIVVRDEDVVGRPDRRPTESLRGARGGLDAVRGCTVGEVGEAQAEFHGRRWYVAIRATRQTGSVTEGMGQVDRESAAKGVPSLAGDRRPRSRSVSCSPLSRAD
jgi:hypothetical protein